MPTATLPRPPEPDKQPVKKAVHVDKLQGETRKGNSGYKVVDK